MCDILVVEYGREKMGEKPRDIKHLFILRINCIAGRYCKYEDSHIWYNIVIN